MYELVWLLIHKLFILDKYAKRDTGGISLVQSEYYVWVWLTLLFWSEIYLIDELF